MRINGLMIDCSRLIEQHAYYYRLLDFMADWGMNTLVWHFTDDYGCAVALPGFEKMAMPHAFSADEMRELIAYAKDRGIDVIPELEAFGHTRYLTDRPEYEHLFAGRKTKRIKYNALDPLNPESERLMGRLMRAVVQVFPSEYLHIGCDEVELREFCRAHGGLETAQVWTDYVNRMIGLARACGKVPLVWGDHPTDDRRIAELMRKDIVLVDWRYGADVKADVLPRLKKAGFERILVAPSIACYGYRFLPTSIALTNTTKMARLGVQAGAEGLINTIWCPYRYVQGALYYGIAYSATVVANDGRVNLQAFQTEFARRVFGTDLTRPLARFLSDWPKLEVTSRISKQLVKRQPAFTEGQMEHLTAVNEIGRRILPMAAQYQPGKNGDVWDQMVLAGQAAWLTSESVLLRAEGRAGAKRRAAYDALLTDVRRRLAAVWDRTRFADSPQKRRVTFPGTDEQYALILMRRLPLMG
jgi:hypothetical protein